MSLITIKSDIQLAVSNVLSPEVAAVCNIKGTSTGVFYDFPKVTYEGTTDEQLDSMEVELRNVFNASGVDEQAWDLFVQWTGDTTGYYAVGMTN